MVTQSQMHKLIFNPINWSIRSGNKICPRGKSKERLWPSSPAVEDIMILTGDICYNPTGSNLKIPGERDVGFSITEQVFSSFTGSFLKTISF